VGISAQHGALGVTAGVTAMHGDGTTGIDGQVSVAYRF